MRLFEAFNFLLSNFNNSYKYFTKILTYLIENPRIILINQMGKQPKKLFFLQFLHFIYYLYLLLEKKYLFLKIPI
jgi:hypothetical protein